MAVQRHEISLWVLKNFSRVSAPFELSGAPNEDVALLNVF